MAAHEDFEEILGGARAEPLHAEVLDDQDIDLGEPLDEVLALAQGLGLDEVLADVEGAADEGAVAGADRAQGDGGDDVALAEARGADEQGVDTLSDEASADQLDDPGLGDLGIRTYGAAGRRIVREEIGLAFREVLARDIRDIRRIAGVKNNEGLRLVLEYYRRYFPEVINKPPKSPGQ